MRPTASSSATTLLDAEEGVARRDDHLVAQRARAADQRLDRRARLLDALDGLVDVAGEAHERLGRLADAEHADHRRDRRQLDLHVIGVAQRVGDLVAGAAGRARVEHEPQRVVGGDALAPDEVLGDDRQPGRGRELARGWRPPPRSSRAAAPRRARPAGGARRPARPSATTTGSSSARGGSRGRRRRGRSGRCRATCSIALCVSEPTILCVLVSTASAPSFSALSGRSG